MENSNENSNDIEEDSSEGEESDGFIYIVPTSHVSEDSSKEVHRVVDDVEPDMIAVELDDGRFRKLTSNTESEVSLQQVLKSNKVSFKNYALIKLFGGIQSKIADKLNIDVIGMDMLAGYEASQKHDVPLALVDQDMNITFRKFTSEMSIFNLIKVFFS